MTSRGIDPFDKRAMGLSAGLHFGLFAIAWLSTLGRPSELQFITYEIEMVSPPPAVQAEEVEQATEELVVERPDPDPAPPEPEVEEVVPVEEPEDEQPDPPREEREEPAEQRPEPDEEVTLAATPEEVPEEAPEESGEGINVRIEGLRRDYPAYYENIIRQIFRCLRWREGGAGRRRSSSGSRATVWRPTSSSRRDRETTRLTSRRWARSTAPAGAGSGPCPRICPMTGSPSDSSFRPRAVPVGSSQQSADRP